MEDDWDLHAVVRGCAAITATTSTATTTAAQGQECNFATAGFQDLVVFEPTRELSFFQDQLHDLYKPFCAKSQQPPRSRMAIDSSRSLPINPALSVLGGLQDPAAEQPPPQIVKQLPHRQQTQLRQSQQLFSVNNGSKASVSHNPTTPRSKRRKNHLKRVCHVPAENLSSDMWSWRKYGQKPIKGSPYPRGYYRCSTSKGCMARKQVERNRSDPGMFIVTYTAEHNHPMPTHRNSLAGSTRPKVAAETPAASDEPNNKPSSSCSPEMSPGPSGLSPVPEKLESSREEVEEENEEDDFSVSNMALDDDFFVGLEDFTAPENGSGDNCISGHIPAVAVEFPWLSNSAATLAGGG